MPITPFIGLSILVHILVIGWRKLFPRKGNTGKLKPLLPERVQKVLGYSIVFCMFVFVLVTAGMLLHVSVTERHSTVYVVGSAATVAASAFEAFTHDTVVAAKSGVFNSFPSQNEGPSESHGYTTLILIGIISLLLFIPFYLLQLFKFPKAPELLLQGGFSLVQVSLLISGIITILAGLAYIAFYILITIR